MTSSKDVLTPPKNRRVSPWVMPFKD